MPEKKSKEEIKAEKASVAKIVAAARRKQQNVALFLTKDGSGIVLEADPKKPTAALRSKARQAGAGLKGLLGTLTINGMEAHFASETDSVPGQLARITKKWLKERGPAFKVLISLPSGEMLSDGEEDNQSEAAQTAAVPEDAPKDARMASLTARFKALKPDVQRAGKTAGAAAKPLMRLATQVAQAISAGETDAAETSLGKLEQALASINQTGTAPDAFNTDAAPADDAERFKRLKLQAAEVQAGIKAAPSAVQGKLTGAFKTGVTALQGGDLDTAEAQFAALAKALEKVGAASAATAATEPGEDPMLGKLRRASSEIGKEIAALQEGPPRAKLSAAFDVLQRQIEAGDVQKALASAKAVNKALGSVAVSGNAEGESPETKANMPDGLKPIHDAKVAWVSARDALKSEMTKLQKAILEVCQGEQFKGMDSTTGMLFSYLEALDGRLERALDAILNEADAEARKGLSSQAQGIVNEFKSELNEPFFQDVDGNNGFTDVKVTSTAAAALDQVETALAA